MNDNLTEAESLNDLSDALRKEVRAAQDQMLVQVLDDELPQWRTQPWTHDRIELRHRTEKDATTMTFYTTVMIASRKVGTFAVRFKIEDGQIRIETTRDV